MRKIAAMKTRRLCRAVMKTRTCTLDCKMYSFGKIRLPDGISLTCRDACTYHTSHISQSVSQQYKFTYQLVVFRSLIDCVQLSFLAGVTSNKTAALLVVGRALVEGVGADTSCTGMFSHRYQPVWLRYLAPLLPIGAVLGCDPWCPRNHMHVTST